MAVLTICIPAGAHARLPFRLDAKRVCSFIRAHLPKHTRPKRLLKAASGSIYPFPSKWLKNGQTGTEQPSRQITETSSPPKWSPLKFLGCWQSEASVWRSLLKAPHPLSPVSTVCVCTCACKLQFSGFIRLHWCLDSRKRSTNRTEWCRNGQKAPFGVLEAHFLSPSLLCSPSISITHSPTHPHLSSSSSFFS